jgi:hypothetical protein
MTCANTVDTGVDTFRPTTTRCPHQVSTLHTAPDLPKRPGVDTLDTLDTSPPNLRIHEAQPRRVT